MAFPVYALLPADVEWSEVPGTTAQSSSPVRWYLRTHMAHAATQRAVLVPEAAGELEQLVAQVAARAEQLGGVAVDGHTQAVIDPATPITHH